MSISLAFVYFIPHVLLIGWYINFFINSNVCNSFASMFNITFES